MKRGHANLEEDPLFSNVVFKSSLQRRWECRGKKLGTRLELGEAIRLGGMGQVAPPPLPLVSVICNRSKLFLFKKYYLRIKSVAKYGIVHMQKQINYISNHGNKELTLEHKLQFDIFQTHPILEEKVITFI